VAHLLVSVRSAKEARLALEGGAAIIDVKEPDQGALGRAPAHVWREVRNACPDSVPLSVALGELTEWLAPEPPVLPPGAWSGLAFRKLGLAHAPADWKERWGQLRSVPSFVAGPPWIAVAYADWQRAGAPDPDSVLETARGVAGVGGILVDTWSKTEPFRLDTTWIAWTKRVRRGGLILAMAGGLDLAAIRSLDRVGPEIVAVRGAACKEADRQGTIDPRRVAELARLVAGLPGPANGGLAVQGA
jgi:uncharacterized protein (UPF0264 family)